MDKLITNAELLEVEGEKLFVASSDAVDRHGEVVVQEGIDISNYKQNPVVLAFHDAGQAPLGFAKKVGFKTINGKKTLVYDPEFHGKTPLSQLYKELKEAGVKLASSIGFIPREYDDNRIVKSELLEISIVNIPANPEALSLAYTKGFDVKTVKEAFGTDDVDKFYELETLRKENEELKTKLASLEVKPQVLAIKGRQPKSLRIKEDLALKALNKALENYNKVKKETK